MRKLAEMSGTSAKEIKRFAAELGRGMSETLENVQKAQSSVQTGIKSVQEASEPFDLIAMNTAQLTNVLEELTTAAKEQSAATEEVAANATAITAATDFASEIGREAFEQSRAMREVFDGNWPAPEKNLDRAGLVSFLAQRVIDHSRWLDKVVSVLRNESKTAQLPDQHNCQLGKWYYGEGRQIIQGYSAEVKELYAKLEEPHRLVHQHGLAALQYHERGDSDTAFREAMNLTGAAREVISVLMRLINAVRRESGQKP